MSESGTILAADTNMTFNNPKNIYENAFKTNCAVMIGDTHTYLGTSTKKSTLPYQYKKPQGYGFGIVAE